MTNRIEGTTPFFNSTQGSKENVNVLPHSIFAKAAIPIAAMRPLAEIAQLTNVSSAESKEPENSLTINNKRHADTPIDEERPKTKTRLLNGNKYKGELLNDLPHGSGTLIYNTGITYVGEFHEGKYHGHGTLTIPNEGEYDGEFKNGFFDGYGTFNYCNGDLFLGNYVKGVRQGEGILYYMEGGSYVGGYQNGIRHGWGTLTSADGDVYQGGFEDGVFEGYGKLTFADGSPTIEGLFANDLFVLELKQLQLFWANL